MPYFEIFDSRAKAVARERAIKAKKSAQSIRGIISKEIPGLDLQQK